MSDPDVSTGAIEQALQRHANLDQPVDVRFLARGEYTVNYRFVDRGRDLVIRLVTGSQMGLSLSDQVAYEAHALTLLEPSGRTPGFVNLDLDPADLAYPYLLIDYLPGRPLDYRTDLNAAAECLTRIHQVHLPDDHQLMELPDPQHTTIDEARELAVAYLEWPDVHPESAAALRRLFLRVEQVAARADVFADAARSIVNTDLNTHNFVVDAGFVRLLDWEKARVGPAVQDLAHFLIPTTTLWRQATSARLTSEEEQAFTERYLDLRPGLDRKRFLGQLAVARSLALLRAISWCAWSVWASATGQRPITNQETLDRSRSYLQPEFLDSLS